MSAMADLLRQIQTTGTQPDARADRETWAKAARILDLIGRSQSVERDVAADIKARLAQDSSQELTINPGDQAGFEAIWTAFDIINLNTPSV